MRDAPGVALLVDDLFRRSAGEITAVLLGRGGGLRLETVEEAVQEAFVQALRTWPYRGVPDNPRGWLYRVAARRSLDAAETRRRREVILDAASGAGVSAGGMPAGAVVPPVLPDPGTVADDELALLLLCCDPSLSRMGQVMLTLKVGCGFSVGEIGAAFLIRPSAVAQRLVRAKRRLRELDIRPPEPSTALLEERAPVLREVLYLLFTGGHSAVVGAHAIRADLCGEALRLGRLMLDHHGGDTPANRAVLALFCLHAARFPARVGAGGVPVLLDEQDRTRWDRGLVAEGFHHLEASARGPTMTRYHVEAAIASLHAAAPSSAETDWARVVELYDQLLTLASAPVVALNRAIAVGEARGSAAGLEAVRAVADEPSLAFYHLLPATLAVLQERLGRPAVAAAHYREAMALAGSAADRAYLEARLARLGDAPPYRDGRTRPSASGATRHG